MERYGDKVRSLAPKVKTFELLIAKWEQNNEPPPKAETSGATAGPTSKYVHPFFHFTLDCTKLTSFHCSSAMKREGSGIARMDFEEENYFNGSDEEDDSSSKATTRKREGEANTPAGDRKRPRVEGGMSRSKTWPVSGKTPNRGLVDYGEDEDEDVSSDLPPGGFIRSSTGGEASTSSLPTSPTTTTNGESHGKDKVASPSPEAPAKEFKLRDLKRKADDDDDDLSKLSAGKGKKPNSSSLGVKPVLSAVKPGSIKMSLGGSGTGSGLGAPIKISFGAKSGNLAKLAAGGTETKEDADKG